MVVVHCSLLPVQLQQRAEFRAAVLEALVVVLLLGNEAVEEPDDGARNRREQDLQTGDKGHEGGRDAELVCACGAEGAQGPAVSPKSTIFVSWGDSDAPWPKPGSGRR